MENTMNEELHQYFTQLNKEEKKTVLQLLKTFVQNRNQDPERISLQQYNQELEESEKQIEQGNFTTQEELEKDMEKW
jgi:hypothetical protein